MNKLHDLKVQLTEDMIDMIEQSVEDGLYVDASEVVREAMRDWVMKQMRDMGMGDTLADMLAGQDSMVDLSDKFGQLLEIGEAKPAKKSKKT